MAKNNTTLPIGVCIFLGVHFLSAKLPEALMRGKNGFAKNTYSLPCALIDSVLNLYSVHGYLIIAGISSVALGFARGRFGCGYREGVFFMFPNVKCVYAPTDSV